MPRIHHVILIHGIRTHARWYELAREVFEERLGYKLHPIKYGRFDLLRFMLPGPWRRGPVERSRSKIAPIIQEAKQRKEPVTVIAHSNGTHVFSTLLKREATFQVTNLVMCGAVVDDDFDWYAVKHKVSGVIVNDYGAGDVWPAVARSLTWGYGYSGTNGIGAPVEDRLHGLGHSGYFTIPFMKTYWRSLIEEQAVRRPALGPSGEMPRSPWWFAIFELPLRWILLLGLVGGLIALLMAPTGRKGDPPTAFQTAAPTSPPVAPAGKEPPAPDAGSFKIMRAAYWTGDRWQAFPIYHGEPRNSLADGTLSQSLNFPGQPDGSDDGGDATDVQSVLGAHSISGSKGRSALAACLRSRAALAACPDRMKAAALELMEINSEHWVDQFDYLDTKISEAREKLAEAGPVEAPKAAAIGRRVQIILRNRTAANHTVYGIRLRVRKSFGAQGDGTALTSPRQIVPIETGTIHLVDALSVDCARPRVPSATLEFESPIILPAQGAANIEFTVDNRLYYKVGSSVILAEDTDGPGGRLDSIKAACREALKERKSYLDEVPPAFRAALESISAPLLLDHQSTAIAIAIKADDGTWIELGTFDAMLP